jgi:hypothetical protein
MHDNLKGLLVFGYRIINIWYVSNIIIFNMSNRWKRKLLWIILIDVNYALAYITGPIYCPINRAYVAM